MPSPALAKKKETTVTKPRQKIQGHTYTIIGILHLHDTRRFITCSWDGSLRVWDIANGTQVGDPWTDEGSGEVYAIALSPNGKIVASGSQDGAVRLWGIDAPGKVMAKWTGHTESVLSVSWSPDRARVVSGSGEEGEFIIWDVESGKTILRPTKSGDGVVRTVCYSPDSTMIATGGGRVKVWDANTGELLKILEFGLVRCLTWTLDEKALIAGGYRKIKKFDTATWVEIGVLDGHEHSVYGITLSPNERILASVSDDTTTRLWDLENDQLIGLPLHLEEPVTCAAFSADGRFFATGCDDDHVYTWDVSAILKEAGLENLLIDNVKTVKKPFNVDADATRRRAQNLEGARRIPPGFFDDSSTSRSHHTATRRQTTRLGRLLSHNPLSWAQNFVSGVLRRQHGSDSLPVPPIVEVPLTAGKPRDYYARKKKPSASSSRPPNSHTTAQQQGGGATQNNLLSSQQPPAIATPSTTPPTVAGTTGAASTISPPDITIQRAGWRARFLLWICCVPIQNTAGQHLGSNI